MVRWMYTITYTNLPLLYVVVFLVTVKMWSVTIFGIQWIVDRRKQIQRVTDLHLYLLWFIIKSVILYKCVVFYFTTPLPGQMILNPSIWPIVLKVSSSETKLNISHLIDQTGVIKLLTYFVRFNYRNITLINYVEEFLNKTEP